MSCTHEDAIDNLAQKALASRRGGMSELVAGRMKIDEMKMECQRECGVDSPWHDVEIDVVDLAAAAAAADAHTWSGIIRQDLAEIRESLTRVFRRWV